MFSREMYTGWHNDHDEKDDDTDDDPNAHLHVFPPHLLPDPVGAPVESLRSAS